MLIKAVRRDGQVAASWDPVKHPRDRRGRFIETGSRVRLLDGTLATVTRPVAGDRIEERRDDGRMEVSAADTVQVVGGGNHAQPHAGQGSPGQAHTGGTAAQAPPAARAAGIHAILAHDIGADVKNDVAPLFEGKYGDFTVKVDSATMIRSSAGGKSVEVTGSVYKDGKKVGLVVRGLHADQHGIPVVHNTEMLLSPKYQGQGFASEFYKQTEARLKTAGVKRARLRANQDVGGYAWARKGFDWASPAEGQQKINDLAARYKSQPHQDPAVAREIRSLVSRARDPASARFPTPYDLSRVGYKPGASTWPGKEFLLGNGWTGEKNL